MAKEWAISFYKSQAWRRCRNAYFISKYGLCERCGGPGKIVHHTIWLTPDNIHDPDVSLNWDNLELLCQTCHNQEHHTGKERRGAVREDVMFDENGNLVRSERDAGH